MTGQGAAGGGAGEDWDPRVRPRHVSGVQGADAPKLGDCEGHGIEAARATGRTGSADGGSV